MAAGRRRIRAVPGKRTIWMAAGKKKIRAAAGSRKLRAAKRRILEAERKPEEAGFRQERLPCGAAGTVSLELYYRGGTLFHFPPFRRGYAVRFRERRIFCFWGREKAGTGEDPSAGQHAVPLPVQL
jgi:hypothetical protein